MFYYDKFLTIVLIVKSYFINFNMYLWRGPNSCEKGVRCENIFQEYVQVDDFFFFNCNKNAYL